MITGGQVADHNLRLADQLRHLVADTEAKRDQELDATYLLQDLCSRLLGVAKELDGRDYVDDSGIRPAYDLTPRESLGELTTTED